MTYDVILEEQEQGLLRMIDACTAVRTKNPANLVEISCELESDATRQQIASHLSKLMGRVDKKVDIDVLVQVQNLYFSIMPAGSNETITHTDAVGQNNPRGPHLYATPLCHKRARSNRMGRS